MSDKIHQLINKLRDNFTSVSEDLLTEKSKNQGFIEEISELKSKINVLVSENNSLKVTVDDFRKQKNDENEEFKLQTQRDTMVSEEHIDELVKEIDYCIGQLKK